MFWGTVIGAAGGGGVLGVAPPSGSCGGWTGFSPPEKNCTKIKSKHYEYGIQDPMNTLIMTYTGSKILIFFDFRSFEKCTIVFRDLPGYAQFYKCSIL